MPGKNGVGRDFLAATVGAARRNAMNDVDIYKGKKLLPCFAEQTVSSARKGEGRKMEVKN